MGKRQAKRQGGWRSVFIIFGIVCIATAIGNTFRNGNRTTVTSSLAATQTAALAPTEIREQVIEAAQVVSGYDRDEYIDVLDEGLEDVDGVEPVGITDSDGERVVVINYDVSADEPFIDQFMILMEVVAEIIDAHDLEVDAVTVIPRINDEASGRVTVNSADLIEWREGSLSTEQLQGRMEVVDLIATGAAQEDEAVVPNTAQPAEAAQDAEVQTVSAQTYYAVNQINVRSCASTSCAVVTRLAGGAAMTVNGRIEGEAVSGSNATWYRIDINGTEGYVYSGLVSQQAPVVESGSTSSGGGTGPQATSAPSFVCPSNCDEAVSRGVSAEQAASCGLDRDGDGVACYGD